MFEAECAYLQLIRTDFSEVSAAAFAAVTGQMKATSAPRSNRAEPRQRAARAESRQLIAKRFVQNGILL
jgi:hypothetical protein